MECECADVDVGIGSERPEEVAEERDGGRPLPRLAECPVSSLAWTGAEGVAGGAGSSDCT